MDVQRKKGILEICVLAVLKKGPSYGYMIIRELQQYMDISESTLYPILKRLVQSKSLEDYQEAYNGRMRKYYRLTPEGQKKIDAFLDEWEELLGMYRFIKMQNEAEVQSSETEDRKEKDQEQSGGSEEPFGEGIPEDLSEPVREDERR